MSVDRHAYILLMAFFSVLCIVEFQRIPGGSESFGVPSALSLDRSKNTFYEKYYEAAKGCFCEGVKELFFASRDTGLFIRRVCTKRYT